MKRIGFYLFAAANALMGLLNLLWGDFDPAHQPIQAFGDDIPGRHLYAYVAGALLLAGGVAMLLRGRYGRYGAIAVALVNAVVGIFWLPRLYTAPHYLGFTFPVMAGVLAGLCMQLIIVCAAILAYDTLSNPAAVRRDALTGVARWIYGVCAIDFGANHLASIHANTIYVPLWMPLGQPFWVVLTGVAFILAGVAILIGLVDAAAAWLLGLMFLVFSALTLLPALIASPHGLANWGGNSIEFVMVGAVWIFARRLAENAEGRSTAR